MNISPLRVEYNGNDGCIIHYLRYSGHSGYPNCSIPEKYL